MQELVELQNRKNAHLTPETVSPPPELLSSPPALHPTATTTTVAATSPPTLTPHRHE